MLTTPLPTFADSIYLNAEGQRNLDQLRLRMRPAPIFEDAAQGLPFIRCVIIGERPAPNPKAPYKTIEGSPEYDVVAFDSSGDQRSATFTISDAWINHIQNDIDSDLDVRQLFSNRDQLAGAALGSRAYFGMVRRAGDPDGALGLWRNDMPLPPEPSGVAEGGIVRFLKDPPIFSADDPNAAKWGAQRRAALQALIQTTLQQRLPTAHMHRTDVRPSLEVDSLVDAIARERAYRLSRTGFDRAALGMLVFMFDLASVVHGEPPKGDNRADAIYFEGTRSVSNATVMLVSATPGGAGRGTPPCAEGTPFCPDPSQRAEVVIDAMLASDGLFHTENWWRIMTEVLVSMFEPSDSPRGRIDLRDGARRLLAHGLNPPPGRDADSERRRRSGAREMRQALYNILFDDEAFVGQHRTVRAALTAGGWGAADELTSFAESLFNAAHGYAADADQSPRGAFMRRKAGEGIATLRAIAALGGSQVPAERQASALVLDSVEQARKRQREGTSSDAGDRMFLELWSAP